MCDNKTLDTILAKTDNKFKDTFPNSFKSVILYGSYARGDFDSESDFDVVALVDIGRPEINKYSGDIVKFSSQIDLEYGIMLSPSNVGSATLTLLIFILLSFRLWGGIL